MSLEIFKQKINQEIAKNLFKSIISGDNLILLAEVHSIEAFISYLKQLKRRDAIAIVSESQAIQELMLENRDLFVDSFSSEEICEIFTEAAQQGNLFLVKALAANVTSEEICDAFSFAQETNNQHLTECLLSLGLIPLSSKNELYENLHKPTIFTLLPIVDFSIFRQVRNLATRAEHISEEDEVRLLSNDDSMDDMIEDFRNEVFFEDADADDESSPIFKPV